MEFRPRVITMIVLIVGLTLLLFPTDLSADEKVSFADANLEAAVRIEIGKPDGPILASELAGITSLNARNTLITSLSGLEYCINLETLILDSDLEIRDLSPISGLTNLRYLYLFFNDLSDLSPLSGLHNLEVLNIEDNLIADITPLSGLTNLRVLDMMDNHIEDITPLSNLVNLEWLSLTNNLISDISPLSGLTNLEALFLDSNRISDILPLSANTGIGAGDMVRLQLNPLSAASYYDYLPQLKARGVRGLDNIASPPVVEPPAQPADPEAAPEVPIGPGPGDTLPPASEKEWSPSLVFWLVLATAVVSGLFYLGFRRRHKSTSEEV